MLKYLKKVTTISDAQTSLSIDQKPTQIVHSCKKPMKCISIQMLSQIITFPIIQVLIGMPHTTVQTVVPIKKIPNLIITTFSVNLINKTLIKMLITLRM